MRYIATCSYRLTLCSLVALILASSGSVGLYGAHAPSKKKYGPERIVKEEKDYTLTLLGRKLAQGELLLLKLAPRPKARPEGGPPKIFWNNAEYPLSQVGNDYLAFLPVPPNAKPGPYSLEVGARNGEMGPELKRYEVTIRAANFQVKRIKNLRIPKKYTEPPLTEETIRFIKECADLKNQAFKTQSQLMLEGNFLPPVKESKITSPFYSRRIYNNKNGKPHGGTDFLGETGDAIYAVQSGRVLLARPMYYEGIFTLIDHGAQIFSFYMHQSETLVKEGEYVKKGALIGKIGSTGMSTGPHLHLGIKVGNTLVDPFSALALKIF